MKEQNKQQTDKKLKEFWKHNLNPITGFPADKTKKDNMSAYSDLQISSFGLFVNVL